jgi:hypothetical protein
MHITDDCYNPGIRWPMPPGATRPASPTGTLDGRNSHLIRTQPGIRLPGGTARPRAEPPGHPEPPRKAGRGSSSLNLAGDRHPWIERAPWPGRPRASSRPKAITISLPLAQRTTGRRRQFCLGRWATDPGRAGRWATAPGVPDAPAPRRGTERRDVNNAIRSGRVAPLAGSVHAKRAYRGTGTKSPAASRTARRSSIPNSAKSRWAARRCPPRTGRRRCSCSPPRRAPRPAGSRDFSQA